jgi:transposase-like protein
LRGRLEAFCRRDLYDMNLLALFVDATYESVRPSGPKDGVLVARGFAEEGERVLLAVMRGIATRTTIGRSSPAIWSPAGSARRC